MLDFCTGTRDWVPAEFTRMVLLARWAVGSINLLQFRLAQGFSSHLSDRKTAILAYLVGCYPFKGLVDINELHVPG